MFATLWEQFRTFAVSNLLDSIVAIVLTILTAIFLLWLVNLLARKTVERMAIIEMEADRRAYPHHHQRQQEHAAHHHPGRGDDGGPGQLWP